MRIFRLLLSLFLTSGLIWMLSVQHQLGGKPLPVLGQFLNPFTGFWRNAEPSAGPELTDLHIRGLKGKVSVAFDDLLVPHIFAENMEDAVRVQGYLTARFRLFQMDITARKASGRLSEVLGERTLQVDRSSRRKGLLYAAENDLKGWVKSPETMAILEAYADGVNAWIDQLKPADYPIEFKLLNYSPEKWSVLKSALVTESMAETLCSKYDDLEATNALAAFGRDTFDYLYPEWNPEQQPVIPDTGQWQPKTRAGRRSANPGYGAIEGRIPADETEVPDDYFVGSNNWAVSPAKSASGHALLSNDPHLNLTLPSIWYQVQLHSPMGNVYGVSLPGTPGVVIGFNEHIAWGVTNVGHDVSDLYRVKWVDSSRKSYLLDGSARDVEFKVEEIGVKGKPAVLDTVRYTSWGPMPYDDQPDHPLRDCALRWTAHDVPELSILQVFLGLNTGKSYDDYKKSLTGFDTPAQNFVFASASGDIALQVQGHYPLREKEQGRFIQDGSTSESAWKGFIPWDEVPSMKNPSRGFVYSANQHSTPPTYPYYYLGGFEDFRSRRIYDRLDRLNGATADSMKTIQLDNFSQRAADCLPAMLNLLDTRTLTEEELRIVNELKNWNFRYDAALTAPPYYEVWSDSCYRMTWDEMDVIEKSGREVLYPEIWRWIELMQTDTACVFFDMPATLQKETARDIVNASFKKMSAYFASHPERKTSWGAFKPLNVKHLALIDAFSRLNLQVGGHTSAPNAINGTLGPSWRVIVELGEQVRAQGVYPGGQSGNPGSRYYDNMLDTWAKGEYYPLLFMKNADEQSDRIVKKLVCSSK